MIIRTSVLRSADPYHPICYLFSKLGYLAGWVEMSHSKRNERPHLSIEKNSRSANSVGNRTYTRVALAA